MSVLHVVGVGGVDQLRQAGLLVGQVGQDVGDGGRRVGGWPERAGAAGRLVWVERVRERLEVAIGSPGRVERAVVAGLAVGRSRPGAG